MTEREAVRCLSCLMNQYRTVSGRCRRCGALLSGPEEAELEPPSQLIPEPRQPSEVLAGRMREMRKMRGVFQKTIAEKAGLQRTYVNKLENAEVGNPQIRQIARIGEALGVPFIFLAEPDELAAWAAAAVKRMKRSERARLLEWSEKRIRTGGNAARGAA